MRKIQHVYVVDETIFTLLSPYVAMLLMETMIFSWVFQVSVWLCLLMSVTMSKCVESHFECVNEMMKIM